MEIRVKTANQVTSALKDSLGPRESLDRKEKRVIQELVYKAHQVYLDRRGYQDSVLKWTS